MQSLLSPRPKPRRPTFKDLLNQADSLPRVQHKPPQSIVSPYSTLAQPSSSRVESESESEHAAPAPSPFFPSSVPTQSTFAAPLRAPSPRRPRSTSSNETLLMAKKKLGKQAKLKAKALKVVAAKGKAAAGRASADPGADRTHDEDQYYVDAEPDAHTSDQGEHTDREREPPLAQHGHGHPHHHAQHHPAPSHDAPSEHRTRSRSLSPPQERRGRSSRPRLLWASTIEPESLRVLDTHHKKVRSLLKLLASQVREVPRADPVVARSKAWGFRVPRMRGPGSEEGRLWSEELDRSGL
mgnify:CR=1 FL=1